MTYNMMRSCAAPALSNDTRAHRISGIHEIAPSSRTESVRDEHVEQSVVVSCVGRRRGFDLDPQTSGDDRLVNAFVCTVSTPSARVHRDLLWPHRERGETLRRALLEPSLSDVEAEHILDEVFSLEEWSLDILEAFLFGVLDEPRISRHATINILSALVDYEHMLRRREHISFLSSLFEHESSFVAVAAVQVVLACVVSEERGPLIERALRSTHASVIQRVIQRQNAR